MTNSVIDTLKARRKADKAELENLSMRIAAATASEARTMKTKFDSGMVELKATDARIEELEEQEAREGRAAAHRVEMAAPSAEYTNGSRFHTSGGETYHRGQDSPSFFRDLHAAKSGDWAAAERLNRNNREVGRDSRALTSSPAGAGSELAPPAWLVEDFVKIARPGRVTCDLFHHEKLPDGVSSLNLPKLATGSTTAIQATPQNTALSQTDLTTTSVSSGISLIGGSQQVSLQLVRQAGIPFDRVILGDLAADYAKQLDLQCLSGTGANGQLRGYLTPASANLQTWTQAAPTIGGFYGQLAKLQSAIYASRFIGPDVVVMHPRRWAWFASGVDSQGRPLVVPSSGQSSFNTVAESAHQVAAGHVGSVLGMDVYTDPNISTTTGAGTNQDVVLMFPRDDIWCWEGDLQAEVFDAPYANTATLLYRLLNFTAMIPDRYLTSLGQLTGTGLVPPTFAS